MRKRRARRQETTTERVCEREKARSPSVAPPSGTEAPPSAEDTPPSARPASACCTPASWPASAPVPTLPVPLPAVPPQAKASMNVIDSARARDMETSGSLRCRKCSNQAPGAQATDGHAPAQAGRGSIAGSPTDRIACGDRLIARAFQAPAPGLRRGGFGAGRETHQARKIRAPWSGRRAHSNARGI